MGVLPSDLTGLDRNTIEAYRLNEAVIYFGLQLENMLDSAGHKPSKEEKKAHAARQKIIDNVFGVTKKKGSGFADPAAMLM